MESARPILIAVALFGLHWAKSEGAPNSPAIPAPTTQVQPKIDFVPDASAKRPKPRDIFDNPELEFLRPEPVPRKTWKDRRDDLFGSFWSVWDDCAYIWERCATAAVNLVVAVVAVLALIRLRRWAAKPSFSASDAFLRENVKWTIIAAALFSGLMLYAFTTRFEHVSTSEGEVVTLDHWTGTIARHGSLE